MREAPYSEVANLGGGDTRFFFFFPRTGKMALLKLWFAHGGRRNQGSRKADLGSVGPPLTWSNSFDQMQQAVGLLVIFSTFGSTLDSPSLCEAYQGPAQVLFSCFCLRFLWVKLEQLGPPSGALVVSSTLLAVVEPMFFR